MKTPPPPPAGLGSWNPYVACKATTTTIPAVLGSHVSSLGGALESGGMYQPHLRGDSSRHLLTPPCFVGDEPTLVQINGVVVGRDWELVHSDGDYTGTLADAGRPDIGNGFMKAIHAEIDGKWAKGHVAPARLPAAGTKVDVQGFVYWDPGHTTDRFHNFSGWELHPLSAWRVSKGANNRREALDAIFPAGAPAPYRVEADDGDAY